MKNFSKVKLQKSLHILLTGIIKSRKVQLSEIAQAVQSSADTRLLKSLVF